jgi:hypothetical protein
MKLQKNEGDRETLEKLVTRSLFGNINATAHAGAEDLASLFCEAKSELYSEERIWPPVL